MAVYLHNPTPTPSQSIKDRVAAGGHDVPVQDVRRRFTRSIKNFFSLYQPLLNTWVLFNNSGVKPKLVAKGKNGHSEIVHKKLFELIKKTAG